MGKGGGSKAHTPVEQPDNLVSSQVISFIDLWCEGPIVGLKDGLKSVFLDNTAVLNSQGKENFSGVSLIYNKGTADQDYLDGFPGSAAEVAVALEVKKSQPVVRTVTDTKADRIRVTVYTDGLYRIENNGDTNRTDLRLSIQVLINGSWVEKERVDLINKKVRGEYSTSREIYDLPPAPFDIRVVRETADGTPSGVQAMANKSYWRSYTVLNDQKYSWPYTAYAGIKFDSKNFSSGQPSRKYLVQGMIVQVPVNYDPVKRTYGGFWNMEFKAAYTNNPAWIIYDIIKNNRYGMGRYNIDVDEMALYKAAQWCDQLVDNGRGVLEPRVTCNVYITEQRQAWDLLNDLFSVFRAMPLWDGQSLSCSIDYAADPVALYNNGNVVHGRFSYSSSAKSDRHSVIEVRYIDKENNYEQATEYVSLDGLIAEVGYNVKKVEAFGTDTRSQARRVGLYILETERLERKMVSFSVGKVGLRHLPGQIIEVADSDYFGDAIGGRILSISSDRKTIELDEDVTIPDNVISHVSLIGDNREPVRIQISSFDKKTRKVTLSTTCPASLKVMSPYGLLINNIGVKRYRCMEIRTNDDGTYGITAVEHYPEKQAIVDNGVVFDPPSDTLYGNNIPAVENLSVEATPDSDLGQARVYWNAPRTARAINYQVKMTLNNDVVVNTVIKKAEFYINVLQVGVYNVTVRGVSADGKLGEPAQAVFNMTVPPKPTGISWTTGNLTASLKPILSPLRTLGEQYEWFFGATEADVLAQKTNLGFAFVMNKVDLRVNTEYWFGVRAVNVLGKSAITTVKVKTKFDSADLDGLINLSLPKTSYIQDLNKDVANLTNLASLRVIDKNGGRPRITGVYVNAGNAESNLASVVDIVADAFAISDPNTLTRWVYFDSANKKLVIVGDIRANGGVLNNVTINENCNIKGTLSASRIEGDVATTYYVSEFQIYKDNRQRIITYRGGMPYAVRITIPFASATIAQALGYSLDFYINGVWQGALTGAINGEGRCFSQVVPAGAANVQIKVSSASTTGSQGTMACHGFQIIVAPAKNERFY